MSAPREPRPLRLTDAGPLLPPGATEYRATVAATLAGAAAAAWAGFGPATRELEGLVRVLAALPAFALGFGIVMVAAAATSDLRRTRAVDR